MAGQHLASRRPVLSALLSGAALWLLSGCVPAFVGTGAPASQRGGRLVVKAGAGYLERNGPKATDELFNTFGAEHPAEFKKRPFGILRYQPGLGGKGAMAMEIVPNSRYPGDPQGQAFTSGVQSGWVVKSINGEDVLGADFGRIMDLLDDEVADPRFSKSTALALEKQGGRMAEPATSPVSVTFVEVHRAGDVGPAPTADVDANDGPRAAAPTEDVQAQEGVDMPVWVLN